MYEFSSVYAFVGTSNNNYKQNLDDRHERTHSKRNLCRHGDNCFTANYPYKHSPNRRACKNRAQCTDFYCSANHPRNRKEKCKYNSNCKKSDCSYLHPKPESLYDNDDWHDDSQARHSSSRSKKYDKDKSHSYDSNEEKIDHKVRLDNNYWTDL